MEPSRDTISSRRDKLNAQILGKLIDDHKLSLITRESLLDALQALYDECSIETLQKYDKQIAQFVDRFKSTISEVKKLRVNITDFEIKDVIGRGHFGEVHVVKEKQTGDVYAMKTIRKCDSVEKTSFDVERDIMAFSTSPWITSLQYAFQDSIYLFFVMEYHPGGDLLGLLYRQGGTLPESAATFYLAEIVLALEDLHSMGYVHRDIKPDNILLDRCGHLKLVDFGSAAKLNTMGFVEKGIPVGTPDYIAPEVLQSVEKNPKSVTYGIGCDYWSLGVLAYELALGKAPFSGPNTTSTYSKIMNHQNSLKFPSDSLLTHAYISLIKSLITDPKNRLVGPQIKKHPLFKNLHFDTLRDQVPPFVPKIASLEDTSNFADIQAKKATPSVENFKKKTQFSGRNLPFVGFSYTPGVGVGREFDRKSRAKDEIIKSMRDELEVVKRDLMKSEDFQEVKLVLERKILEKNQKLENVESVREKLERELAASMAESTALKRTLEIERKDRAELERKALDLIKSAKIKWETSERTKVESLKLEIEQQKEKITQLVTTNNLLNEQLQRAFKMENKHKESLEAVEQLNRRSLVGLESRLEKVALDSRHKILNLQVSLDETAKEKRKLEKEIERLKDNEDDLKKRLVKSSEDYSILNCAATEAEKLVKELGERVNGFEKQMENTETLKCEINKLTEELEVCRFKIKDLEHSNLLLKDENKAIEEYKNQINSLKKKINELESKLLEEEQKIISLKKELENSEKLVNESQELKELRVKMWKMEKELGNAKIDKRIAERELKELQNEIKSLKTMSEENKKIHASSMLEMSNIHENLSMEMIKMKEAYRSLEEKLETEKNNKEEEKLLIVELKESIKAKDSLVSEVRRKAEAYNKQLMEAKEEIKKLNHVIEDLDSVKKKNEQLIDEVKEGKRQLENAQTNLEALREACVIIENQVIEYEKINASIQAEKSSLAENTERLINDLCKAKEDIQEAKKATNEEKSFRLLAETKVKRLTEDVESLQSECRSYKDQCLKYKECSNNLSEELTACEEKVSDLEVTMRAYERQIEDFVSENNLLKEEISQYLTQMAGLKESNFKMKQQIQELKGSRNLLSERADQLEGALNAKINYYEEREMKNESIIKQQTKLIDYLQVKIDENSHKKKTLTDIFFGSSKKENQQPITLPVNYKDLESQLAKQKQLNKNLQEEIYKLKAGLNCKTSGGKITRHKSEIVSPKPNKDSKEPNHRFVTKLCKKLSRCDQCTTQITPGRDMSACSECSINVHQNCVPSVKSTCDKYYNMLTQSSVKYEGWIKVLNKSDVWERRYARLTDSRFNIYSNNTLVESIDLNLPNSRKKVVLEPLPSEIGTEVASSDLPFVIKIEVSTECWPLGSLVFMALSMDERDRWYKALQYLDENPTETIVSVPDNIYVNCIIDVTKNIKVLGTDQGLYSHYNDLLFPIVGPTEVSQICVIPESKIVVMISGLNNQLSSCDLNHLINLTQCAPCTNPKLTYRDIEVKDLDGFHYLTTSGYPKHQLFCAATSKQLVLVKYDLDSGDFIPLRVMDTAEPLGCALFTEHSLIVGADKFFEIDLASFKAEEFLDGSDARLKMALKCPKIQSFPLAILHLGSNPKEYLLCFNEFAVFVDEYGRSSREEEIKTTYLPIGFHYAKGFLYIVQFTGVEIVKINDSGVNGPSVVVDLKKMRFLGMNSRGVYVMNEGKVKFLEGRKFVDCDDVSTETGDESDRFSFTSSMVQSLDGNSSDVEEDVRRVQFSQTNL